ncbi:terpenoid synthase [Epithele typhae]|uniref:terpenoid synthase n=1 Tax=Epithele typhae TaxID=378194 RepID=UPI002008D76B|nr:terpenoid synthase [Epithele typhae]KAH9924290.1 terpenoid synthase [Epithele typhae]
MPALLSNSRRAASAPRATPWGRQGRSPLLPQTQLLDTPPHTLDLALRAEIEHEIILWDAYPDNPAGVVRLADVSCSIAEKAYLLLSPAHRRFVALYTACLTHIDDNGSSAAVSAAQHFSRRFARGERQMLPALETLARLLREDVYELFPSVGADAIVSNSIDAVTSMYLEYSTGRMAITPGATRWPDYFRAKTGICAAYTYLMYPKGFRDSPETYLQMVPYMDHWIGAVNDILSFYKEELAHETNNYVSETLTDGALLDATFASDAELDAVWQHFKQGYMEFHVETKRYRLAEVGV